MRRVQIAGAAWATTVAIAVLAASRWLDTPTVQYLVAWAVATVAGGGFAWSLRGERRRWAFLCVGALAVGLVFAGRAQRDLARITAHWTEWQTSQARAGLDVLGQSLTDAERRLTSDAAAALRSSLDRESAFSQLQSMVRGPDEHGVVVYRGDSAFAWAGSVRVSPDTMVADARRLGVRFLPHAVRDRAPRNRPRCRDHAALGGGARGPAVAPTVAPDCARGTSWTTSSFRRRER